MQHHVTGIFSDPQAAERAVRELIESHFSAEEISIVVSDREGAHEEEVEHDTGIAEGATGGAAIGGALGMLGATLVATGVVAAPGLAVFATGPLLAALKGAVGGAAFGLEVGALGGMGFWKDEAHIHAEALKKGGVVVAVPAEHEHAEHARKVFTEAGADDVRG
jgi:predicted O-methyltransferase YrrM